ncbi:uncharacterized protein N0V89_004289 [Didymosphaeria variabile]|uniref:Major facilitator superfamily (MFS) profile domain-containing protein n=1 Tax=Didymosphaeria variabile TaxID=1932322 RepID=A0A9W9CD38_9PLEO|nr:uncharacterized protein N0V89_004289 [Didymosphaeria variabile]KAJ4356258.1 hypothetical protein N0V89_004289 [Didymosphaeria variabile]
MFRSKSKSNAKQHCSVGEDLVRVLPNDDTSWYQKPHLLYLNYLAISMGLLAAATGYDGSMMNGLQALPQWTEYMDHPTGAWLGFINAIQFISSAVAYPITAYFANRWGRKKGIFIGYFFIFLGALLQTFAPNDTAFILSRMFVGQPSAWWGCLAPLLITELAYPTHRSFLTTLYNCGYYVGSILSAWAVFGTRNIDTSWAWRIPSLLQIAIPLVVLPAAFLIPESPRYLIAKDRMDEARAILVRFHAGGDEQSLLVDFEMNEMEQSIKADVHNADILTSVGITSVTDQTLISGCLQIWNLIAAVGATTCVDTLGRRKLFLISSVGMLVSFILISGLSGGFATGGKSAVGLAVVPFLYIYYGFYDIAFTPLLVSYPAEIWPYHLRARGIALTQMSTYVALFFNTFVNPIALDGIGWKYYVVFAVILLGITMTIWLYYPETKGHTLEEMAVVFDGADAAVSGTEALQVTLERKGSVKLLESV